MESFNCVKVMYTIPYTCIISSFRCNGFDSACSRKPSVCMHRKQMKGHSIVTCTGHNGHNRESVINLLCARLRHKRLAASISRNLMIGLVFLLECFAVRLCAYLHRNE